RGGVYSRAPWHRPGGGGGREDGEECGEGANTERRTQGVSEMTPDRLRELRRIAEAGPAGEWDMIELEHSTVLALLDEIERLRRVLEQVEWEQSPANCPICDGYKSHGHAPDCELAAALGSAPAGPPAAQERPERAVGEEGREGR